MARYSRRLVSITILTVLISLLLGCGGSESEKSPRADGSPSLLLITLDTWRWDYIGASGENRVATPFLDRLADEGLYEPEVLTPCPLTTPAHSSLFTGLLPLHHGVMDCISYTLPEEIPTLAESFRNEGYETAAFVSCEPLKKRFRLDRGFDHYDDSGIDRRTEEDWHQGTKDGALTTAAVLTHLNKTDPEAPKFYWVHYFDCHVPYRSRTAYDEKYPDDPYAAQVAFLDDQLQILLNAVRGQGGDWRVVIVGDHGEGLGDHEESGHGVGLYRSTLHVPLVIHPAPDPEIGLRAPWALQDLAPTLLRWFGLAPIPQTDGKCLFDEFKQDRALPALTLLPAIQFTVNPCLGIRKGPLMYIRHGVEELYDMEADPGQERDLSQDSDLLPNLKELRQICSAEFPLELLEEKIAPNLKSTPEELESLRGLGYVGGLAGSISELQRSDLRVLMAEQSAWVEYNEACYDRGECRPLVDAYRRFLRNYPKSAGMFKAYGLLCLKLNDYKEAMGSFDRAARLNPKDEESLMNLGTLYIMHGDLERARVLLEAAVLLNPGYAQAHKNLGILYGDYLKTPAKAIPHYEKYLELQPGSAERVGIQRYIDENGPSEPTD